VENWYNKVTSGEWKLVGKGELLEEIPVTRKNIITMKEYESIKEVN